MFERAIQAGPRVARIRSTTAPTCLGLRASTLRRSSFAGLDDWSRTTHRPGPTSVSFSLAWATPPKPGAASIARSGTTLATESPPTT